MPVDNDVYDRLGESWWDETSLLNLLHGSVTPARFAYFRDVLSRQPGVAIHDWDMFITPAELAAIMERHELTLGETAGLGARARPLAVLRSLASVRLGRITYGELSRRLDVGRVSSTAVSYMGFATKTPRQRPRLRLAHAARARTANVPATRREPVR